MTFGSGGGALPNKSDHNDGRMTAMMDSEDGSDIEYGTGAACCRFPSWCSLKEIGVGWNRDGGCDGLGLEMGIVLSGAQGKLPSTCYFGTAAPRPGEGKRRFAPAGGWGG